MAETVFLSALALDRGDPANLRKARAGAGSGDGPGAGRGVAPGAAARLGGPVLLGVPLDRTTTYRSGTGLGPTAIREASWSLETYSPALEADLEDLTLYDAGDVSFRREAGVQEDLTLIEREVAALRGRGLVPLILGGEHLVTWPAYQGVSSGGPTRREPPALFHYDAHADLREECEGTPWNHATVFRRIAEAAGGENLWQFGIRSGEREEMRWGRANVNRPSGTLADGTRQALSAVAGRAVYVSVDIDVLDPAQAPGTGNPEPGGPTAEELCEVLCLIGSRARRGAAAGGIDLVGADLVEVAPELDPSGRTGIVAAKVLREFLLSAFVAQG